IEARSAGRISTLVPIHSRVVARGGVVRVISSPYTRLIRACKTDVWLRVRIGGMGQRQDLLAGAKRCIAEKGYSRTTARDIPAASGANLAAIGYHFGSKEALLN